MNKKELKSSKFIEWLINPININYGKMQGELFRLRKENEILRLTVQVYQIKTPIKSLAELELEQIKNSKLYRFINWYRDLFEKLFKEVYK